MSVIIRLQNLPWSANALDIRQYFQGLSIPEGGVHIVGGELGDAFIAFSTDEDARQAFIRNNGKIREVQITLMLSSRTEMQRVIEQARSQSLAAFMQPAPTPTPVPAAVPFVPPAVTVDVKKEGKERDRGRSRRSRSKSRDRKDRDRKDKRYRDRSRSRSRDRKSSRRRDRSRDRSRSRDKERRSRDRRGNNRRSEEQSQREPRKPMPEVWATQPKPLEIIPPAPQPPSLLNTAFPVSLDQAKMTLTNLTMGLQGRQDNGFSPPGGGNFNNGGHLGNRDSWPPANQSNFGSEGMSNSYNETQGSFQDRFHKSSEFQPRNSGNNRLEYETVGCCVALEPFYGGYGDVRRFFQGMFIGQNGIKFINDPNGRRTGIVYVRFSNRMMKEEAMDLSGESLNGVTVTISHVPDEEYDEAVDRYLPTNDNSDNRHKSRNISKFFNKATAEPTIKDYSCLVVDDLPTYCKEQDILHMFSQHPLVALTLTTKPKGGHIAYVKFSNVDVAKKANDERSLHVVGGKQVTVRPCKDSEFEEIDKQNAVNLDDKAATAKDVGTECLSVSRLPLKTSDKDIADFFSDIGVIPTKIHLMSNQIGFTGQAYCEFQTTEEATRAAKKHETVLGQASISVTPIKREEMDRVLGTTVPALTDSEPAPEPVEQPFIPPKFAAPPGNFGMRGVGRPFPNRTFGGPRFGPRGLPPRPRFGQQQPPEHGDEVPPGCTVYIKNLPYKAGTNDILEFFDGYRHTGNVSRRYNPNNTPSDEAKVMFFDPQEASRAVRDLNKCKIWDRQAFLRQE